MSRWKQLNLLHAFWTSSDVCGKVLFWRAYICAIYDSVLEFRLFVHSHVEPISQSECDWFAKLSLIVLRKKWHQQYNVFNRKRVNVCDEAWLLTATTLHCRHWLTPSLWVIWVFVYKTCQNVYDFCENDDSWLLCWSLWWYIICIIYIYHCLRWWLKECLTDTWQYCATTVSTFSWTCSVYSCYSMLCSHLMYYIYKRAIATNPTVKVHSPYPARLSFILCSNLLIESLHSSGNSA